jgi:protein O-mannose beta-1,4-N-acetylglucosaminyltransferase
MTSFHAITHAVMLAVIATLLRKHSLLLWAHEELQFQCACPQGGHSHPSELSPNSAQTVSVSTVNTDETSTHMWAEMGDTRSNWDGVDADLQTYGTTVWCQGGKDTNSICHFRNLCYYVPKDEFVILHSNSTVEENLPVQKDGRVRFDTSSVIGHNLHQFTPADLPASMVDKFSVHWINDTSLLFSRFKPDNFMHVLHDDILPLHHTLELISSLSRQLETGDNRYNVQLVFIEGWDLGPFEDLYQLFTRYNLMPKQDFPSKHDMVCFKDAFVGLSTTTTWYQYGFIEPQGPLPDLLATGDHIHNTVHYLQKHLSIAQETTTDLYVILISRKDNRRILNEMDLSLKLAQATGLKVIHLSFETHDLTEMIRLVSGSVGLVGMHGSLMTLSMFLPPSSFLVELFPYAVNPDNYTPFRTLASLPWMDIAYAAWANQDRDNSVGHPDWPSDMGGLGALSTDERETIIGQTEVPAHLCCEDPSWLYHIYQDTTVDVGAVTNLVHTTWVRSKQFQATSHRCTQVPSSVSNVACMFDTGEKGLHLELSWQKPWTVEYLSYSKLLYEIWVKDANSEDFVSYFVDQTEFVVTSDIQFDITYHIWIRCVLDETRIGHFGRVHTCMV